MELNDILWTVEDQDKGRWFTILHPVTGAPTSVSLLIAGPDSRVQAEAAAIMTDELAEAADDQGRVSGAARADIRRRFLARCVRDWRAVEGGEALPFTFSAVLRILGVAFVAAQVDAYAGNRSVYFFKPPAGGENAAA